jgi:hypothetical protein
MKECTLIENKNGIAPFRVWPRFGKGFDFMDDIEPCEIAVISEQEAKAAIGALLPRKTREQSLRALLLMQSLERCNVF